MCIANGVLYPLGGFASGFADAAGDVADGRFEGFVEHLAERVADDGEEALVVGSVSCEGARQVDGRCGYLVLVERTVGGDVGHFWNMCVCR